MLFGRWAECARIDRLLEATRAGASGVLVVCGEPGIGKTTLLRYAVDRASGMRVLSVTGVEPEAMFPFAALGRLLAPVLGDLAALPSRQAAALRGALALEDPQGAGDRFAVYAAAFGVIAAAAEHGPMLIVVDDAQWLDPPSAEAVTFVARRLRAEGVAVLVGTRESAGYGEFEVLTVGELNESAAAELVCSRLPAAPAADVVSAVVAQVGGNPLALTEVADTLTPEQMAGRRPLPVRLPAESAADRVFGPRLAVLGEPQRRTVELAAVAAGDGLRVVLAAMAAAGLDGENLEQLEVAGLLILADGQVFLCHPLLRTAALSGLPAGQRRRWHRLVADLLTTPGELDRRAWHLSEAALGPDDDAADALEDAADLARARSGYAAAALALERAADLSMDNEAGARRFLAAADAARLAGTPDRALRLLAQAEAQAIGIPLRAAIAAARGRIEMFTGNPKAARVTLQAAASAVAEADSAQAATLLAAAADAAYVAGDSGGAIELCRRAMGVVLPEDRPTHVRLKIRMGLALSKIGQLHEGAAELREVARIIQQVPSDLIDNEAVVFAAVGMVWCGEAALARQLLDPVVHDLRASAALGNLPFVLYASALADTHLGHLATAQAAAAEAVDLAGATGDAVTLVSALGCLAMIEAQRGDEQACRAHAAETLRQRERAGVDLGRDALDALGLLELSLGHPARAIAALEQANRPQAHVLGAEQPVLARWSSVDLIEAYTRSGQQVPEVLIQLLQSAAGLSGPAPAVALAWRGLALLADEQDSDDYFARALDWHTRSPVPFETARTRLCYGERLRRAGRRRDARAQLRLALEVFEGIGAKLWADRARMELTAAGYQAEPVTPRALETLTAQELQVAQVAAAGATNREAATQLFLSVKTIEMHLGRAYRKLGVRSRTQLANLLR